MVNGDGNKLRPDIPGLWLLKVRDHFPMELSQSGLAARELCCICISSYLSIIL